MLDGIGNNAITLCVARVSAALIDYSDMIDMKLVCGMLVVLRSARAVQSLAGRTGMKSSSMGLVVAGSMIFSSTAAVASTHAPATQIDPWAALSAMSGGASAAVLCGSAATAAVAAAQPATGCVLPVLDTAAAPPPPGPVPVPAVETSAGGLGISPLLIALGVVAAGAVLFLALHHHHHHNHANSPA